MNDSNEKTPGPPEPGKPVGPLASQSFPDLIKWSFESAQKPLKVYKCCPSPKVLYLRP